MAISDAKKGGGGSVSSTQNGASDATSSLIQFEELCSVLGINHSQRLKELGINPDKEVDARGRTLLAETIHTLRGIKDSRFEELKESCTGLIELWKTSTRSLSKNISLDQIYAVADAKSSDEMKTEKLLSTQLLGQVAAEKMKFENTDKAKYQEKKKQLTDLMKQSHLTHREVKFDPDVNIPDLKAYKKEIIAVKKSIKLAKCALLFRKELVFQVELLQRAISRGDDLSTIDVLVGKAKEAAGALITKSSKKVPMFDGLDVYIHIGNLWSMAVSLTEDLAAELKRNSEAADLVAEIRRKNKVALTRSRSRLPTTAQAVPSNNSGDLPAQDTKRIIHLVFSVMDLEGAIKCYTECFGMNILSEDYEDDYSIAFLGYGLKEKNTSLVLIHRPADVEKLNIGKGFGHVCISNADVNSLTKAVEVSCFCKVAHKPCRLPGCSTTIAFFSDPSGLLFEVVESNHLRNEPISRVMHYVKDVDRSVHFYEKALGMQVLKRKDEEIYKIVFLGYGEESEETVLELRCSDTAEDYDHGTAFVQFVIGTHDVDKSTETLKAALLKDIGGKVVKEPSDGRRSCSFLDPDGWKWVLVDYAEELM